MSDGPLDDADRSLLYARLWSPSDDKPYDEAREAEVARRRFGPAQPFIAERAEHARAEGRRLRVLDFGCADGHTAEQILAGLVDEVDYLGTDLYPLEETRRRMRERGFRAEVSTGGLATLPDEWHDLDVVLALSCFQYIPDTAGTFAGLASRLAPGGILIGYFYDAAPLRRVTDKFLREVHGAAGAAAAIDDLRPLAELFASLRDATRGSEIVVREAVPELGIPAGTMPLQRFLIDHLVFAWAPEGADTKRIQWALGEMLLTGPQVYLGPGEIAGLLAGNGLALRERVTGPSGHLVVAQRA